MAERPSLHTLAAELGILAGFRSHDGGWAETSDETRVALLAAMGIDAATEERAHEVLAERRRRAASQLVEPVAVVGCDDPRVRTLTLGDAAREATEWEIEVETESGERLSAAGTFSAADDRVLPLPQIDAIGRYRVRIRTRSASAEAEGVQQRIVVPRSCVTTQERLGAERAFGVLANLYAVRDGRSDFGDFRALKRLLRWAGSEGASFVGVNPLNAIRAGGNEISPYSPTTRIFRSELYLDLQAIPEMRRSTAARRALGPSDDTATIEYPALRARKRAALRRLHRIFVREQTETRGARGRAYDRFVARGGALLQGYATFCALDEHFGTDRGGTHGWHSWPEAYRDPHGEAVRRFAHEHADEIDFHQWVQFEIDRQLGSVAQAAERSGLALGVYQDLPIGAVPSGYEEWWSRHLFCHGASVGAPPDAFFAGGQNWGLAPLDPHALRADGYVYWSALLRAAFAHSGALRIDHVMGLARQYWVPAGMTAREGAYVRMPADELFGVLALESRRAGAVVIGEDLGTVPEEIPTLLERWGVLSTKVLYFERTGDGGFRPPHEYPVRSFVSANTHDLATLAGYEAGRDVDLNEKAGVLDAERATEARSGRGRELAALRQWANAGEGEGLLRPVYATLASSPAALLGVSLDDLGGEVEPVNLPGVSGDVYPSWRRRMRRTLAEIAADPTVAETLAAVRREERSSPRR